VGGDLQTVANRLRGLSTSLSPHRSERLQFPLPDGTETAFFARLDRPAASKPGAPLVILIHGLTGAEDSLYMLSMARLLLDRGSHVLRLNLRGAGPSRGLCGQHYYAGRSQDSASCWPCCRMSAGAMALPPSATRWAAQCC